MFLFPLPEKKKKIISNAIIISWTGFQGPCERCFWAETTIWEFFKFMNPDSKDPFNPILPDKSLSQRNQRWVARSIWPLLYAASWSSGHRRKLGIKMLLLSHSVVSDSLPSHGLQHTRLPYPSPTPGVCSDSCPLSQWCHPSISSSVVPISSCLQSFPASGSFPISRLFTTDCQSLVASASVLLMNIQGWFPLGLTGLISLQSKGLSRVFSNTIVQKDQFFSTQLFLLSSFHIHTWLLEKS